MKRFAIFLIFGILAAPLTVDAGEQRSFSLITGDKWTSRKKSLFLLILL